MSEVTAQLWTSAAAYERYMGRWSRKVAPLFAAWIGAAPGQSWLELGCGTGVLTQAVLEIGQPARVVAIDSAPGFLELAKAQVRDPRVAFRAGDAQAIPEQDAAVDVAVAGLVLNFVADQGRMIGEMARAVRPDGTVAVYVWDYAGHMQMIRHFFDAAATVDPKAAAIDEGVRSPICRPGPLRALFARAGLAEVDVQAIDIPTAFSSFDDYWTPFLGGTGPAPRYCMELSEPERERLRLAVRERLPIGPDGEILLAARAWGARGRVTG